VRFPSAAIAALLAGSVVCAVGGQAAAADGSTTARATASTRQATTGWDTRMLSRVNAVRAAVGAQPVTMCPALMTSAQGYAEVMARDDFFGHVGPDGSEPWDRMTASGYRWRNAAENIAAGQPTVYAVMQAWRASAPHLAAITDPAFTHVGFGYARSPSPTYPTYWVQDFGAGGRC